MIPCVAWPVAGSRLLIASRSREADSFDAALQHLFLIFINAAFPTCQARAFFRDLVNGASETERIAQGVNATFSTDYIAQSVSILG